LGLLGVPGDAVVTGTVTRSHPDGSLDDMTTPRSGRPEVHRRSTTGNSEWGSTNLLAVPPSGALREGSHRTLEQVLRSDGEVIPRPRPRDSNTVEVRQDIAGRNSMNSVNSSASSWGTVHTSARGSMSDLGLIGLHRGGGVTGQGSVAEGSQSTPMFGRDIESETEGGAGSSTPRMGWVMPRPFPAEPRTTRSQGYASDDERPRHLRSVSHPEVPFATNESHDLHNSSHDDQAIQPNHARSHSLTQPVSLDSGAPPPSVYVSQPTGNALALSFDDAAPFAVDARGATHEQIRAPAPRVGGPNVLNLWRSSI